MFWFAVNADPMKNQLMGPNIMAAGQQGLLVQPFIIGQIQIKDPAAHFTAEMRMGLYVGIVPLHRESHPHSSTFVHQQIQIPVYRSQTQVGIGGLEPLIQHFSGGMLVRVHQDLIDQLSLT